MAENKPVMVTTHFGRPITPTEAIIEILRPPTPAEQAQIDGVLDHFPVSETQPAPCGCWLNDSGRGHWSACWENPENKS